MTPPPPPPPKPNGPPAPPAPKTPPDRAAKIEAIFHSARTLPKQEREAYIAEACGGDASLQAEVMLLLASVEGAWDLVGGAVSSPEIEAEMARLKPEEPGDRTGRHKLREQIGEGGFGTVWVAEQEEPVKRRVALKIIKLGMDTKEVIARFEQERQALALMDHPNIAKVFDAGATQFGRPFFVMELVRGIRITDYCDQHNLPTTERLQLFIAVCHAVQHAHQKGIIHRDLKPSNILVTLHDGAPVPKVIDFGVAKATQGRLTDRTIYTQFQQMIGTPLYMSPEQAEMTGLDVDTRSDIYSLGVLLYELLTGRTPVDSETLLRHGLDEIRRIIREQELPKPSTALKTMALDARTVVAKHRQIEPPKLVGLLRGDLDWIVMKALEKDRTHRYETVNGLAVDLQRHLASEPVLARPPGQLYRFRRMVRRNKVAFFAGTVVVLTLIAGLGFSTWMFWRERDARKRAVAAEGVANRALTTLGETAPIFFALSNELVGQEKFEEALEKIGTAVLLEPGNSDYALQQANLLEATQNIAAAAAAYRRVLALRSDDAARTNLDLCERLLNSNAGRTQLARESQIDLFDALLKQERVLEAVPLGKILGRDADTAEANIKARMHQLTAVPGFTWDRVTRLPNGTYSLTLGGLPITELPALAGLPITKIDLAGTKISNITFLIGLRLTTLYIHHTLVSDLKPIANMPLEELSIATTKVSDLSPLRATPLKSLECGEAPVTDLRPLAGLPLELLYTAEAGVDLSPLRGMPLHTFCMRHSDVSDISPLAGLPIKVLILDNNRNLTNIGVVKTLPLKQLILGGSNPTVDLSPLAECLELEILSLPENARSDVSFLRGLPKLRQLGEGICEPALVPDARQFWKKHDANVRAK